MDKVEFSYFSDFFFFSFLLSLLVALISPQTKPLQNVTRAFEVGEKELNIPRLIQPDHLADGKVDDRSVKTYVSFFPLVEQQRGAAPPPKRTIPPRLLGADTHIYISRWNLTCTRSRAQGSGRTQCSHPPPPPQATGDHQREEEGRAQAARSAPHRPVRHEADQEVRG